MSGATAGGIDVQESGNDCYDISIFVDKSVSQTKIMLFVAIYHSALAVAEHTLQFVGGLRENDDGVFSVLKAFKFTRDTALLDQADDLLHR